MQGPTLEPIGYVRTGKHLKFDAPHQPNSDSDECNEIELIDDARLELALDHLVGFEHIWLLWWFHKNSTWRSRVIPPRGPAVRRGVFATRSPHRPNPIGLTAVRLLSIDGRVLTVGPLDLVESTPILDIKPYIPKIDSFPDSRAGWVDELDALIAANPTFQIRVEPLAAGQLAWLEDRGIRFAEMAFDKLRLDPNPHRTRRILDLRDGRRRMACGPWRLYFRVEGHEVVVESVGSTYTLDSLPTGDPSSAIHAAFLALEGESDALRNEE